MKAKIFLISLCTAFMLVFYSPAISHAAAKPSADNSVSSQFTVTPAVYEHVLQPGKTTTQIFQLTNKSQLPLPIKSYVRAFDASDETGGVDIQEEPDIRRLAPDSWVNVDTPDFIIQPNSTLKVNVTFSPPIDLPPGGYYAIVFFEPQLPESFLKENSSLQINGRVGALLFLVGAGDIKEKGTIANFSAKKWNLGSGPIDFKASFQNQGNVHLRPSGQLQVKNIIPILSHKIETMSIDEVTVLPNKTRQLKLTSASFRWPGIYQAKITLTYGRDKNVLDRELTFIFLPWKYILSLVLLVLFIFYISKRRNRRRLAKAAAIIEGKK